MKKYEPETFNFEVNSVVWCPSMELYGVIAQDDARFEVKRCTSGKHTVYEIEGEVSQFMFMDDKALRSIVAYTDGKIDIINTDDGKVLFTITHNQSVATALEIVEHHKCVMKKSQLRNDKKKGNFIKADIQNSAQKFLLPIQFNEATKNLKRKLKYFETYENTCFMFLADQDGKLSVYLNSCFPITSLNLREMVSEEIAQNDQVFMANKIKASKDLSKLFLQIQSGCSSHFLMLDTRFIGYKSGMITDMSKLIYESFEYLKFIENKIEECSTFWNIANKKYSAEMMLMERAAKSVKKEQLSDKAEVQKTVTEELRYLLVYSVMSDRVQEYIMSIASERKEMAKREEIIQNEFDKIENLVTNFIMPSVEVVLLKLSTLRRMADSRERYELIGLNCSLIDQEIQIFFNLYQKLEELNLSIVEAKLDVKNLYVFINKHASKHSPEPEKAEMGRNALSKYILDNTRLLKFLKNKNGEFKLEKCKSLLGKSSKVMQSLSKDLNVSKPLDNVLAENLEKIWSRKQNSEDQKIEFEGNQKVSGLIQEAKHVFNQIYKHPETWISKFYRQLQQTTLVTSQDSKVLDMYVESKNITQADTEQTNFGEESKVTMIKEHNLSDSNDFESDMIFAIKYTMDPKTSYLCIYFQNVAKKVSVEDKVTANLALVVLPDNYDLCECIFHGKKTLVALIKPNDENANQSIIGSIDLEKLDYSEIEFEERVNDLEHFIGANHTKLASSKFQFEPNHREIDNLSVSNLASSGTGLYSALVQKRKLVFFK